MRLNKLLKVVGVCESSGAGKALVAEGVVSVGGQVELRKARKVRAGSVVTVSDVTIKVMAILVCLFATNALALTPPYGEEMLKQEADLIVKGEVGDKIKKDGVVEKNKCADTIKYVAPLKVVEVCKGKADRGAILPVVIYYKDYKSGCVGDQDASYHPGEQGLFYLKQGSQKGTWRPVHWDGVVSTGKDGSFPKCP